MNHNIKYRNTSKLNSVGNIVNTFGGNTVQTIETQVIYMYLRGNTV